MLFYLGLSRMGREETIAMTAQLKVLTGFNIVNDSLRKSTAKVKSALLGGLFRLLERQGHSGYACQVRAAEGRFAWDTEILTRKLDQEAALLSLLTDGQLSDELRRSLQKLSGQKAALDDQNVAIGVLERAARSLGIDPACYIDPVQLELVVFDTAVERQCKALEERLRNMSPEEREKLAVILEGELNRLSQNEREAIRNFTGVEALSGQAMLTFLRTLFGVAMAKLFFTGAGFGAFLFLTTVMKATSLLFGVSLSFGAYAAASSALAVLASAPVLVLAAGLSGGFLLHKTSGQMEDQLAQLLVVTGHWRMAGAKSA